MVACLISIFTFYPFAGINFDDHSLNDYIQGPSLNNKSVVLHFIKPSTVGSLKDYNTVISGNSFSYRSRIDNLLLGGTYDILLGGMLERLHKSQEISLQEQLSNGVRGFEVMLSKDDKGNVVLDNGVVYGSLIDFATEVKALTGPNITIYYGHSQFSGSDFTDNQLITAMQTVLGATSGVTLQYIKGDTWGNAHSRDREQILNLVNDASVDTVFLTIYRDLARTAGILVAEIVIIFLIFCIVGWLVWFVWVNRTNGGSAGRNASGY